MNILIIYTHPNNIKSNLNDKIIKNIKNKKDSNITIKNLYNLYSNFKINVKKEQEDILKHKRIILQFPIYWYGMPSLLKKWIDEVFSYGFSYGPKGDKVKGKEVILAITTGGNKESYSKIGQHKHTINEFLIPIEMSIKYMQMKYIEPFVTYDARGISSNKNKDELINKISDNYFEYMTK